MPKEGVNRAKRGRNSTNRSSAGSDSCELKRIKSTNASPAATDGSDDMSIESEETQSSTSSTSFNSSDGGSGDTSVEDDNDFIEVKKRLKKKGSVKRNTDAAAPAKQPCASQQKPAPSAPALAEKTGRSPLGRSSKPPPVVVKTIPISQVLKYSSVVATKKVYEGIDLEWRRQRPWDQRLR